MRTFLENTKLALKLLYTLETLSSPIKTSFKMSAKTLKVCNPKKVFKTEEAFNGHNSDLHNHRCEECDRSFPTVGARQSHFEGNPFHVQLKVKNKYRCSKCEFLNLDPLRVQDHYKRAHIFNCKDCTAAFDQANILATHAAEHSYRCNSCAGTFKEEWQLKQHCYSTHWIPCVKCDSKFDVSTYSCELYDVFGEVRDLMDNGRVFTRCMMCLGLLRLCSHS